MENKTMDKIRYLLAMAEHENSNEYEAAIAMRKAQELLLQNNLTRADIQDDGGQAAPAGIGKVDIMESTGFGWKRYLIHTLAVNNLCQTVSTPHDNTSHVFGTYDNVKAVLEMYHWLSPELERIAMKAWKRYKADGTGQENARSWKHGFFMGAIKTINDKLKASIREFEAGPGHAVVPYNAAMVNDAVKRVYPYLTKSKASTRSYDGMAAGRAAGGNINLRPQRKLSGIRALK